MGLYTGGIFYPLDPRPEEVDIRDIAHALSMSCRYTGHVRRFYSVAEHSVLIAKWLETRGETNAVCFAGLLHDAGDAYLSDIASPAKRHMPEYRIIEDKIIDVVLNKYGIEELPEIVKFADKAILDKSKGLRISIVGWTPAMAEHKFLEAYRRYVSFN
jgi:5'-deoxynucleotidase YfbR-like HD superfamily hydrolase